MTAPGSEGLRGGDESADDAAAVDICAGDGREDEAGQEALRDAEIPFRDAGPADDAGLLRS